MLVVVVVGADMEVEIVVSQEAMVVVMVAFDMAMMVEFDMEIEEVVEQLQSVKVKMLEMEEILAEVKMLAELV